MPDVQEVFRMATQKIRPDQDALERQHREQRRRTVRRRVQVYGLVAAMLIVAIVVAVTVAQPRSPQPAQSVTPSVPIETTAPMGAQIVGLDGTALRQVAGIPAASLSTDLSRDGTKIVFCTYSDASPNAAQIATINADGTGFRVVTDGIDAAEYPRWSPNGARIAYVTLDASSYQHIFVMDADGSNSVQVTSGHSFDTAPAWSPDGTTIAFQRGSSTSSLDYSIHDEDIWVVPSDGSGTAQPLTHEGGAQEQPDWSPDGKWVAFGDETGLSVIRVSDASRVYHLGHLPGGPGRFMPRWSPDGSEIAFLAYRGDGFAPFPDTVDSTRSAPLLRVYVATMASPIEITTSSDINVSIVTDESGVSWAPNGRELLIYRYA
jgi:Tol biopolymer transport system component